MSEASLFCHWLTKQANSGLLPSQIRAVVDVMDRLDPADLIAVFYFGDVEQSTKAMKLLKKLFMDEMHFLDQINQGYEYAAYGD